ncbi:hypothetical protein K7432_014421 [Basidiobolus ranarum]|uniref:Phosphodiester glycosidase domain-containing protein n=1 Tax=Basidiobolus ranarum TaxID=34480 RepID=A0ABR2WHM5_9FUNG
MTTEAGLVESKELSSTVIISDLEAVGVAYVGAVSVANSGHYGINGGFFNPDSNPPGDLLSITHFTKVSNGHQNQKQQGGNGSSKCSESGRLIKGLSYDQSTPTNFTRGTIICHRNSVGELTADVAVIRDIKDSQISEEKIQWAMGGYSLHLDKNYNDHDYLSKIQLEEHACSINKVGRARYANRSAIGFRRVDRKIVLASFRCCSVLEVRKAMRYDYLCDIGIMLDGGGSSQISGFDVKTEIHIDYAHEAQARSRGKEYKGGRPIYSMVTVDPSAWVDVRSLIQKKVLIPAGVTIGRAKYC